MDRQNEPCLEYMSYRAGCGRSYELDSWGARRIHRTPTPTLFSLHHIPLLQASSDDSDDVLMEPAGPDDVEQLLQHQPGLQLEALNRTLDTAGALPADAESTYSTTAIQRVPELAEPALRAAAGDTFSTRGVQAATPHLLGAIRLWTSAAATYRSAADGEQTISAPTDRVLRLHRAADRTLQARIFLLTGNALQDAGATPSPGQPPPFIAVDPAVTPQQTVELFTLNEGQAAAFLYLAHQFELDQQAEEQPNRPAPPPRRFIVQGGPGSGKTQLIRAVQWFAFQHRWPRWLTVTAYTWRAAGHVASPCQVPISSCSLFGISPGNRRHAHGADQVRATRASHNNDYIT